MHLLAIELSQDHGHEHEEGIQIKDLYHTQTAQGLSCLFSLFFLVACGDEVLKRKLVGWNYLLEGLESCYLDSHSWWYRYKSPQFLTPVELNSPFLGKNKSCQTLTIRTPQPTRH